MLRRPLRSGRTCSTSCASLILASDLPATTFCCEQLFRDTNPPLIVEAVATLRHFRVMESGKRKRPRQGPRAFWRFDRLPDAAGVGRCHRLTNLAAEGLAELVEVLHAPVDAPHSGGVRVGLGPQASGLLARVLAPHLAEADEVALSRSVVLNLRG